MSPCKPMQAHYTPMPAHTRLYVRKQLPTDHNRRPPHTDPAPPNASPRA
jgi:hypothetical protein